MTAIVPLSVLIDRTTPIALPSVVLRLYLFTASKQESSANPNFNASSSVSVRHGQADFTPLLASVRD